MLLVQRARRFPARSSISSVSPPSAAARNRASAAITSDETPTTKGGTRAPSGVSSGGAEPDCNDAQAGGADLRVYRGQPLETRERDRRREQYEQHRPGLEQLPQRLLHTAGFEGEIGHLQRRGGSDLRRIPPASTPAVRARMKLITSHRWLGLSTPAKPGRTPGRFRDRPTTAAALGRASNAVQSTGRAGSAGCRRRSRRRDRLRRGRGRNSRHKDRRRGRRRPRR